MIRVAEQILDNMDIWHRYKYVTLIPLTFLPFNLFF